MPTESDTFSILFRYFFDTFLRLFRYFFETFFVKIRGKVLVSEDYVQEKKTLFSGYIRDLSY